MGQFFHIFANGDDAGNFITSETDFDAAFNRVAVCAFLHPEVKVLGFSIEESHTHFLTAGERDDCVAFKLSYESLTKHYIVSTRGNLDDVVFELEILDIENVDNLRNVAAYVIVQATKDGKRIMPYDYRWGTASMYFRPLGSPQIWQYDSDWNLHQIRRFGEFTYREKRKITHSHTFIPDDWFVCNNLILPSNYIDVAGYENIFVSFNRYRTFLSAGKKQLQQVTDAMISVRGVSLTDLEARRVSATESERLFGKRDSRWLLPVQRMELARVLRQEYRLSIRQISILSRLPETEIRKYIY